jgi:hypothetical protein
MRKAHSVSHFHQLELPKHTVYHYSVSPLPPKVKQRLSSQLFWQVQISELLLHNCISSSFGPRNRRIRVYFLTSRTSTMIQSPFRVVNSSGLRCCSNHCRSPQNCPLMQTASRLGAQKKAMKLIHVYQSLHMFLLYKSGELSGSHHNAQCWSVFHATNLRPGSLCGRRALLNCSILVSWS